MPVKFEARYNLNDSHVLPEGTSIGGVFTYVDTLPGGLTTESADPLLFPSQGPEAISFARTGYVVYGNIYMQESGINLVSLRKTAKAVNFPSFKIPYSELSARPLDVFIPRNDELIRGNIVYEP